MRLNQLITLLRGLEDALGDMPDVAALASSAPGRAPCAPMPFPQMLMSSLDLLLREDWRDDTVIPEGSLTELASGRRYASIPGCYGNLKTPGPRTPSFLAAMELASGSGSLA